ncbi:MAG: zinc ABC transporter substrate-binding protein [Acidobacteria bacterium]|nr:zinc ABC transporter substrate-binding protein [Acidobacteriota bacterium]
MRPLHLVLLTATLSAAATLPCPAALRVVTTLQDLASLTDAVGGARVTTFALAKGYQDPHYVDAKPSLVLQLSRADLLVVAGLDLEAGYLRPLVDQSRNARIHPGSPGYLDASAGCEVLQRPTGEVTRAMGDVHPYGNPHYWTDPENGRVVARAIAARLAELDPAGAAAYQANLQAFEKRLDAKLGEWQAKMAPFRGTKIVTFHNSWPNFAKRFGLEVAGHVEPKPGIPPTPSHTLDIINLVRNAGIKVILVEPYFDLKTPKHIASATGARVLVFYPSVGGLPEITDYFALFDHDLDAFVAAMREAR